MFSPKGAVPFRDPATMLRDVDMSATIGVLAAAGDVVFVIDADGVIRDIALGSGAVPASRIEEWVNQRWVDIVTIESRVKIEEMLAEASINGTLRWRQVNHGSGIGDLPMRYLAMSAGKSGRIIAIGRDMRAEANLQQRLLQAQQSMERDYVRLRQAEARYRMLFDLSSEAVFIVDTVSRQILDANPAANLLIGVAAGELSGRSLPTLFANESRDTAVALLGSVAAAEQSEPATIRLVDGTERLLSASLFRQDRGSCFLVRLMTHEQGSASLEQESRRLFEVLDRLPDAFVVTNDEMMIIAENAAFLDLAQLARKEQSRGQPLARFLGRQGIDLNLLVTQLREHGSVRNFSTIVRGAYDTQDEVEVSAVAVIDAGLPCFGFSIRNVGRRLSDLPVIGRELPRSVEQLTELVGRVSLKEIVRESTDLIERLCIEAALTHTADNRASAAEILGLSRQSLYSKLHRHGIGNLGEDSGAI